MRVIGLLILLGLAGCVSNQDQATTWLGASKNEVIMFYGAPDATAELEGGRELLQYNNTAVLNGFSYKCSLRFMLADDRVQGADVQGKRGGCNKLVQDRPLTLN